MTKSDERTNMADRYTIQIKLDGDDQLSPVARRAQRGLDDFSESANRADGASRNMVGGINSAYNALDALAGAGVITGFASLLGSLNAAGEAGRRASVTYREVAGSADEAAAGLERMRQITGGVIDDTTLMSGANSLLITGLADTTEQAGDMVNMATRLSVAMGVDAADGIENFNAAMLNMSFERLDTLGLSSARVRERMRELEEQGYETEAAFRMAVLEEGEQALLALGDAANLSETSMARLQTRIENMTGALGDLVNRAGETGAQLLEMGFMFAEDPGRFMGALQGQDVPAQREILNQVEASGGDSSGLGGAAQIAVSNPELAEAIANGGLVDALIQNGPSALGAFGTDVSTINQVAQTTLGAPLVDPNGFGGPAITQTGGGFVNPFDIRLPTEIGAGSGGVGRDFDFRLPAEGNRPVSPLGGMSITDSGDAIINPLVIERAREMESQFVAVTAAQGALAQQSEETARSEQQLARAQEATTSILGTARTAYERFTETREQALSQEQRLLSAQEDQMQSLQSLADANTFQVGDTSIFDPSDLDEARNYAADMRDNYEEIAELARENDYSFISEEEVARAQDMALSAENIAREAERGAAAFANMSLSDLMGVTDGGRLGDLTDIILDNIEDPVIRAQVQLEFDLASGRTTSIAEDFENRFGPTIARIAEEYGAEAALAAAERGLAQVEAGRLAGLTDEQISANVRDAIGYELSQSDTPLITVEVQQGDSLSAISARTGISVEDLRAANGGTNLIHPGQQLQIGQAEDDLQVVEGGVVDRNRQMFASDVVTGVAQGADLAVQAAGIFGAVTDAIRDAGSDFDGSIIPGPNDRPEMGRMNDESIGQMVTGFFSDLFGIGADGAPMQGAAMSGERGFDVSEDGTDMALGDDADAGLGDDAEAVTIMADGAVTFESSMMNVAALDFTGILEPFNIDLDMANTRTSNLDAGLANLTQRSYVIDVPMRVVIQDETGLEFARSPAFQQGVRLYLAGEGITVGGVGAGG